MFGRRRPRRLNAAIHAVLVATTVIVVCLAAAYTRAASADTAAASTLALSTADTAAPRTATAVAATAVTAVTSGRGVAASLSSFDFLVLASLVDSQQPFSMAGYRSSGDFH